MGQIKGRANLKDCAAVHSNKWGNMNMTFWERGFSSAYKKGPGDGSQKILDFWSKLFFLHFDVLYYSLQWLYQHFKVVIV